MDQGNLKLLSHILTCLLMSCYSCLINLFMIHTVIKAPFLFKCEMLSYVLYYPGVGKVFNVPGSGAYKACAWCEIQDKYCVSYKLV